MPQAVRKSLLLLPLKGRGSGSHLLPHVALVHSHEGLADMPQAVRKSLEDIYFITEPRERGQLECSAAAGRSACMLVRRKPCLPFSFL